MISVIIPVHNRPVGAQRAVASVLGQVDADSAIHEVIVVDDSSQPPLKFDHHDRRVKITRLEPNGGAAAARNAGIRAASGQFIAFLDSDDVWLPGKISSQLKSLHGRVDKRTATVCGFYYPNRLTGRLEARMPRPATALTDWVSGCWFCPGSSLLIPRSAFDTVGLLDERLRRLEDLDWFIRFGQRGGQLEVASCMGTIIAPSYSGKSETVMTSSSLIEQKFGSTGPHPLGRAEWRRLQAYLAIERGAALLYEGKRLRGLGYILASLWHKPRLQPAVEAFWERSDVVPDDVMKTHHEMLRQSR